MSTCFHPFCLRVGVGESGLCAQHQVQCQPRLIPAVRRAANARCCECGTRVGVLRDGQGDLLCARCARELTTVRIRRES